jgi:hypothetical protein
MKAPNAGVEVTLQIPQRERVAARVSGTGKGWLELGLLQSARTPMAQMQRMRMFVEYVNEDGVCRLLGALETPEPGAAPLSRPSGHGIVDVVRFAYSSSPQLLQRREFIRTDFVADINLCRIASNAIAVAGKTVNVSGGGVLIRGMSTAQVGDLYTFDLALFRGDPPISGTCRVMRVTGDGLAGVMFTEINSVEQDRIIRWAFGVGRADKDERAA